GAMHASDRDRALARDAVVDRHDAPAIDPPRNVVLLLACRDAAVALDAALGIAKKFHSSHRYLPRLCRFRDLTERRLGFLHHRHRIGAVRGGGVDGLRADDRMRTLGIELEHVLALPPTGEVEGDERRAGADAIGDQRLDVDLRAGRRLDPNVLAVADTSIV